ncbi:hypothetical protein SLE2022_330790 [Rubroshorea leprosula]
MCICCGCDCFNISAAGNQQKPAGICDFFLAIFLPPVAVYNRTGSCGSQVWLNLLLTVAGVIPGSIHAVITLQN